jgi:hypothetical protein
VRRTAAVAGLLALVAGWGRPGRAQTPAEQLARGVRSYQSLDFERAATALRAALARTGPGALSDSDRFRGLVYLGATELYRSRRDSAAAAFGQLLLLDPRYRVDQLLFPPEVTGLFQQVRLTTRAAAVAAPPLTQLRNPGDRLVLWVYTTSTSPVDVSVLRANGVPLRSLYRGDIADSLPIAWDGRAADGTLADSGHYLVRVDARGPDGKVVRSVGLTLDVARVLRDTLPLPAPLADSLLQPEFRAGGRGYRALITGLAAATAVVVLPPVVASQAGGMHERYVLAWALGTAGLFGLQFQRRPQPIPENIASNQALRLAWQRRADSVLAENAARRRNIGLDIHAGAWRPVAGR